MYGLKQSLPLRSGPSLEVRVRPEPPFFLSGSQGSCGRNSCHTERLMVSFRARPGWGKNFFNGFEVLTIGGIQDHRLSELVFTRTGL